ncbi:MAG: PDZ domain-containing protein [Alphaproteobacteria bacterium]|nr:PDZ domain-containing protein [Alphaproteobacteria bacterium]
MSRSLRVGAVLAVLALIVAQLWPRDEEAPPEAPPPQVPAEAKAPAAAPATHDEPDDIDLTEAAASEAEPEEEPAKALGLDAVIEDIDWDKVTHALCAVEPAVEAGVGHLLIGAAGDPPPYDGRLVKVAGGMAHLPLLPEAASGVLTIEGFAPVDIQWTGAGDGATGACTPDPIALPPAGAGITGVVENAEGEPVGKVFVEGCGNQGITDADGTYWYAARPGPCAVQAFRRDGLWAAPSERVEVTVAEGEDTVVNLSLPPIPRGGLGIHVAEADEGILVMKTVDGSAAQEAGLVEGDVIVEIEGIAAAELDLERFVELAVGDAGTEVEVVVRSADGTERPVTLDRRALPR